jgi:hypothetical protein
VEVLRRADWIDVPLGAAGNGVPREFRRAVMAACRTPASLAAGTARQPPLLTRPWDPMPMMLW